MQLSTTTTYRRLIPIVFANGPTFTGTDQEPTWVEIDGSSITRIGNGSPLRVPNIADVQVEATIVAGNVVFEH